MWFVRCRPWSIDRLPILSKVTCLINYGCVIWAQTDCLKSLHFGLLCSTLCIICACSLYKTPPGEFYSFILLNPKQKQYVNHGLKTNSITDSPCSLLIVNYHSFLYSSFLLLTWKFQFNPMSFPIARHKSHFLRVVGKKYFT